MRKELEAMRKELMRYGLAAGLLIGLGLNGAEAAAPRPISPEALGLGSASTPVAMCGFRCAYGGRYIPGPPGVCYARGLNYCGPSGGWGGPPPWAGRGFYGGGPCGPRPYYGDPYRRGPDGPGPCGRPYGW
jgi:hypothetical protein